MLCKNDLFSRIQNKSTFFYFCYLSLTTITDTVFMCIFCVIIIKANNQLFVYIVDVSIYIKVNNMRQKYYVITVNIQKIIFCLLLCLGCQIFYICIYICVLRGKLMLCPENFAQNPMIHFVNIIHNDVYKRACA